MYVQTKWDMDLYDTYHIWDEMNPIQILLDVYRLRLRTSTGGWFSNQNLFVKILIFEIFLVSLSLSAVCVMI